MESITLRDDSQIPQLGLGTWQLSGEACSTTVARAIEMGYRHIDTAFAYSNHREVGAGIKASGVDRSEIFLTSKIPLGKQQRSQVLQLGQQLQDELDTEYVDLLLIHWPNKNVPFSETLGAMGELVKRKVSRSIGISNFNADIAEQADEAGPVPVVTNQVEFHPLLFQADLLRRCAARGIVLTAYSPLGRGEVLGNPTISEIAEAHNATPAQVAIAWILSKGVVAIPKASSAEHLDANLKSTEIELSADEIASIDGIETKKRMIDGPWKHFPLE
jgi:diketogulonate reductase-like aldo/keto reductase